MRNNKNKSNLDSNMSDKEIEEFNDSLSNISDEELEEFKDSLDNYVLKEFCGQIKGFLHVGGSKDGIEFPLSSKRGKPKCKTIWRPVPFIWKNDKPVLCEQYEWDDELEAMVFNGESEDRILGKGKPI